MPKLTNTQVTILITLIAVGVILYILYKAGLFVPRVGGGKKGDQTPYKNKARDIHDSLIGNNASSTNFVRIANDLLDYDRAEFISTVNAYAVIYDEDEYNTLRKLINGEYFACGEWYWVFYTSEACELRNLLNQRLDDIGA